jgi:hypothetical protein
MKKKRGRHPLPPGFTRVYFNVSEDDQDYLQRVRAAQKLTTRSDVLRLIVTHARSNGLFLTGNDANLATEQ